jgi:hypothetical protein
MTSENEGDPLFEICEVFYDRDGIPVGHGGLSVMSETIEGLREVADRMKEALDQPVLTPKDFKESEE